MRAKRHIFYAPILISFLASCSNTPESNNANTDNTLTPEQQVKLITMLEQYDDNQRALAQWQAQQPSLARLVEIEGDLKTLIMQLNMLSQQSKANAQLTQNATDQSSVESSDSSESAEASSRVASPGQTGRIERQNSPQSTSSIELENTTERTVSPEPVTAPTVVKATPSTKPVKLGGVQLQLTALNSIADITTYWDALNQKHPLIFAEQTAYYEAVTNVAGKTLYRLKFGNFGNLKKALEVCDSLEEIGVSCFIATTNSGIELR